MLPPDYEPPKGKKHSAKDSQTTDAAAVDHDKFGYADASGLSISEAEEGAEEFDLS